MEPSPNSDALGAAAPAPMPAPLDPPELPVPEPLLPSAAAPSALDDDDDDDDGSDKSKVSRWQIGTSSLSILEQVYQMEPFPGMKEALKYSSAHPPPTTGRALGARWLA